jgi:hypothetical protein
VGGQILPTASDEFHLYSLDWTEDALIFKVDGKIHLIMSPQDKNQSSWPFDSEQYLLLNVAIQDVIEPSFTESALEIDFIKIYQESTTSISRLVHDRPILIYPNLIENEINIDFDREFTTSIPIKIYNLNGKLVLETYLSPANKKMKINNLGGLSNGLYLITFEYENTNYSSKFFKN